MHDFSPNQIITPEFDYNILMSLLQSYKQPWSKIRQLLKQEEILRVKKGIYVKNPSQGVPYSACVLANMIYGPSYISGVYALAFHGMIPERVESISSVTIKPSKEFKTPVGFFSYQHLSQERYSCGFIRVTLDVQRAFLIATPEKALVDTIWNQDIATPKELYDYLRGDLRIDEACLRKFDATRLQILKRRFKRPIVDALSALSEELAS